MIKRESYMKRIRPFMNNELVKVLTGMPFLSHLIADEEVSSQYLRDVYNSVILKDVVQRNAIRDVDLLERISTYVLANVGHSFSATGLSKYFKSEGRTVAPETILNYIRYCVDAFLFYRVNRENMTVKKILTVNEKYYAADHGFRGAVYGSNDRSIDQILENIVCMEAIRRGYLVTVGKNRKSEIDFVLKRRDSKIYIQVAYLLGTPEIMRREFGAFKNIPDNYPKYVVSLDEFDMSRNGYKHRNIRDFLCLEEWEQRGIGGSVTRPPCRSAARTGCRLRRHFPPGSRPSRG